MRTRQLLPLALLLVVAMPASEGAKFDGIPFSSTWELVLVGLVLHLLTSSFHRAHSASDEDTPSGVGVMWFWVMAASIICIKTTSFLAAPTSGQFEVCYRHYFAQQDAPCLPTFEPLPSISERSEHFARRSLSVREIDFKSRVLRDERLSNSTWRLPFVNKLDYDIGFWPWVDQDRNVEIFPFRAEFRGVIDVDEGETLQLTYVGQGRLSVGDTTLNLPAAYERPNVVQMVPDSRQPRISLDYAFLRTIDNATTSADPYARLQFEVVGSNQVRFVESVSTNPIHGLNTLTDVSIGLLLVYLLWLARSGFRTLALGLSLGFALWIVSRAEMTVGVTGASIEIEVLILIVTTIWLSRRRADVALISPMFVAASTSAVTSEVGSAIGISPSLGEILIRLRGNDHLVYHRLVREMLESGFLRGGEDTYYFQPGIRYVFFVLQMIFGESGVVSGVVSVSLLGLGILFVIRRLQLTETIPHRSVLYLASVFLLLWWSSSHTVQSAIFGLSEFGTWILILFMVGLMLGKVSKSGLGILGIMAAAVVWIRPNQGFSMIALLMLGTVVHLRSERSRYQVTSALMGLTTFVLVLGLVPLHNVVFGRQLVFLPSGHLNAGQSSWLSIVGMFSDDNDRVFVISQLKALAYLPSVLPEIYSARLGLAFLGFFVVTVMAAVMTLRLPKRDPVTISLGLLCVVGQVVPFLKYTLIRYYPIHNIAIYLTTVLTALLLLSLLSNHNSDLDAQTLVPDVARESRSKLSSPLSDGESS
ncbi:MAG: hypothetical protein ACKOXX_01325 [Actinomycetota bacterium]